MQHRPQVRLGATWSYSALLASPAREALASAIAAQIADKRWFGARSRTLTGLAIVQWGQWSRDFCMLLARAEFGESGSAIYQLPLALAVGQQAAQIRATAAWSVWAEITAADVADGVLYDGLATEEHCLAILATFDRAQDKNTVALSSDGGQFLARPTPALAKLKPGSAGALSARLIGAEQSNSSIVFGDRLILKLYRRVEQGVNPDAEISAFLTARGFAHSPALAGTLEYQSSGAPPWTLGLLQEFVSNQGDAWQATLKSLDAFLTTSIARKLPDEVTSAASGQSLCAWLDRKLPDEVTNLFGSLLKSASLLGERTGQMHHTLAGGIDQPDFAPLPTTVLDVRQFVESRAEDARQTLATLAAQLASLPAAIAPRAKRLLERAGDIERTYRQLASRPIDSMRIRCHGDYHLGQVLVAGDDYLIIDFEGEPARSLAERRQRNWALVDVAGMIRSFHYASCTAGTRAAESHPNSAAVAQRHAAAWYYWTSVAFLSGYRGAVGSADFVPKSHHDFRRLLEVCLLAKAVYELQYELNNRPDWVYLPLGALDELLADSAPKTG